MISFFFASGPLFVCVCVQALFVRALVKSLTEGKKMSGPLKCAFANKANEKNKDDEYTKFFTLQNVWNYILLVVCFASRRLYGYGRGA